MVNLKRKLPFLLLCTILPACSWWPWSEKKTSVTTSQISMPIITNEAQFVEKVIKSEKPTVVKFHAQWCAACKAIQPMYEEIADKLKKRYTFFVLDVDKARTIAGKYRVRGIPAFLFFNKGKEVDETQRIVGAVGKQALKEKILKVFEK